MEATVEAETSSARDSEPLERLKAALLKLKPDGDDGFEGLIAHALASVMARHFRVARAGRQHGRDGAAAPGRFDVFFETKLHSGKPPSSEELQAKFFSAINDHHPRLDLWAIATTSALGENAAMDLQRMGERYGIAVVILDWSTHILPPLAVLLGAAKEEVIAWLRHRDHVDAASQVEAALDSLLRVPAMAAARTELLTALAAETTGLGAARAKNAAWLEARFASRRMARQAFGQFIAPADPTYRVLPRPAQAKAIGDAIGEGPNTIVAITGDQGLGKTWLVAEAWRDAADRPILLLCTTDTSPLDLIQRDPRRFLAQLLLEQTDGDTGNDALERWMRRLENWKSRSETRIGIWLVLDGLNERESLPWMAIIDKLMPLADELGIRLVLTSRTGFFDQNIRRRLHGYVLKTVAVAPFTRDEVRAALTLHGQESSTLATEILDFLRNPRIFGIAVSMLDRLKVSELRPERLLFEYWRKRIEERANLRHTDFDMRQLLVSHARSVRQRLGSPDVRSVASFQRAQWKDHSTLARRISGNTIDDELSEVESGGFFTPDDDHNGNYTLRPESFAYSLGLLVVEELRTASAEAVTAQLEAAIDPVRGHDLLGDILLAALGIACIDDQCSDALAVAILQNLLGLQNLPDAAVHAIASYVTARPSAFIAAAEAQWSREARHQGRPDWLRWLLFAKRDDVHLRPLLETALRRWLSLWCREPDRDEPSGLSDDELAREAKFHRDMKARIASRLSSLTDEEKGFLAEACHEIAAPHLMLIDHLAVELLVGWPLAPFADTFVAWTFCNNLSGRLYGADDAISWLLRLNPTDHSETAAALRIALGRIRSARPSQTGLWTAIGVLSRTGCPEDAAEVVRLVAQLENPPHTRSWRRVEDYCDTDPLDPDSPDPSNIQRAVDKIVNLDIRMVRKFLSTSGEDHELRDLTPALSRHKIDILAARLRAYACDLQNRSNEAARFLGFSLPKYSALLTSHEVGILRAAFPEMVRAAALSGNHDDAVGAQYVLMSLLPHLPAADQLDALLELPTGESETLQLRLHFKPLPPDVLERRLTDAEQSKEVVALRRVLFFASASKEALTERARRVVQRALTHTNHVIRLLAFEVSAVTRDSELLVSHAQSAWSALDTTPTSTEGFYGSKALSHVPPEFQTPETLLRMTIGWQTSVADRWSEDCLRQHAAIVLEQVRNCLALPAGLRPDVSVDRNLDTPEQPSRYPYLDAREPERKNESLRDVFRRMSETEEEWQAEQKRRQGAIDAYVRELKRLGADRLVDATYIHSVAAIIRRAPEMYEALLALFRSAQSVQLPQLCNIVACAAIAASRTRPEQGGELLAKIARTSPDIQLTIGAAQLPFHRMACWLADDHKDTAAIRQEALRVAANDAALFREALSAAYADKQDELLAYARALTEAKHPAVVARGIMLAGFADANDFTPALLQDARFATGFLAEVAAAARYAYERNVWARHWYGHAQSAETAVEWWRAAELMICASDGRFVLWYRPDTEFKPDFQSFAVFAQQRMKDRAKSKLGKRAKTLFGLRPPTDEMLTALALTD